MTALQTVTDAVVARPADDRRATDALERADRPGVDDRVVLITGSGSGLGRATANVLAAAGLRVVVADLRLDAARETAAALDPEQAIAVPLDVRDGASASSAVAAALDRFGRLDVLINNAGTDVTKAFDVMSADEWGRVIDVNLRGPMTMTQAALPALRDSGHGHVVNITSTAAKRAWTEATAYHASKWGLLGFSHALHAEARRYGVKVTAVVCGGMQTPFILDRFPDVPLENLMDPAHAARTIRFVLDQPPEVVIPEVMVLPLHETSWP
ncbi:MAG TPA: SDR family oxidoreductase [Candidatus Limnocylindrales bacterium]|nr:SDR family oxidoreductase [Candidatus Limnocylindrales bacterium]